MFVIRSNKILMQIYSHLLKIKMLRSFSLRLWISFRREILTEKYLYWFGSVWSSQIWLTVYLIMQTPSSN